jgi:hypothetical protein
MVGTRNPARPRLFTLKSMLIGIGRDGEAQDGPDSEGEDAWYQSSGFTYLPAFTLIATPITRVDLGQTPDVCVNAGSSRLIRRIPLHGQVT